MSLRAYNHLVCGSCECDPIGNVANCQCNGSSLVRLVPFVVDTLCVFIPSIISRPCDVIQSCEIFMSVFYQAIKGIKAINQQL